jgi:hypothetical protein
VMYKPYEPARKRSDCISVAELGVAAIRSGAAHLDSLFPIPLLVFFEKLVQTVYLPVHSDLPEL